ncbi:MAG: hypothetical protein ACJ8J0_16875 [Longimicrobiaceae bacterium]
MTRTFLALLASVTAACPDAHVKGEQRTPAAAQVPAPSAADSLPTSASVFVGCGFLLVENHGTTNFTVLLRADDARQASQESGSLWVLDGVAVETQVADAATMGAPQARGDQLLHRHREWETGYTAETNGWTGLRTTAPRMIDLNGGMRAMTWSYDTPTPLRVLGFEVTRVLYVTTAVDDLVFVMSAPLRPDDDAERVLRTIHRSLATLRSSDRPTDVYALSAQVQGGPRPWAGCPRD